MVLQNLTVQSKSKLARLVQTAPKIVAWVEKRPIQEMYELSVLRRANTLFLYNICTICSLFIEDAGQPPSSALQ